MAIFEALRMAVEAGIDFIQHPEILSAPYPQDLIAMIVERDVICGLRSNTLAGEPLLFSHPVYQYLSRRFERAVKSGRAQMSVDFVDDFQGRSYPNETRDVTPRPVTPPASPKKLPDRHDS